MGLNAREVIQKPKHAMIVRAQVFSVFTAIPEFWQFLMSENIVFKSFISTVDCKWSSYTEWSECSQSCGGGARTSNRTILQHPINGGQECTGTALKTEACNLEPCPGRT